MGELLRFEDAREIIRRSEIDGWNPDNGTFHVLPVGSEDATHFYVVAGAYEDLVESKMEYTNFAPVARFVDKRTGEVEAVPLIGAQDRISRMRRVSTGRPEEAPA